MITIKTRNAEHTITEFVSKIPTGYEIWTSDENIVVFHDATKCVNHHVDVTSLKAIVVENKEIAKAMVYSRISGFGTTKKMDTYLKKYGNRTTQRVKCNLSLINTCYDALKAIEA